MALHYFAGGARFHDVALGEGRISNSTVTRSVLAVTDFLNDVCDDWISFDFSP